ncbi:MAG: PAC2 family protein [archaeon]|nr:PAC2 family protein [archaeon]
MTIELSEKPKNPTIIEGFPGFGFVSTIATEFLVKHLNAKKIGRFYSEKLLPISVIHDSKVIEPLEIYYAKKENIVILRTMTNVSGAEWEIAKIVKELAEKLKAKEIISIEGISAPEKSTNKSKVFFYTNQDIKKFEKIKLDVLKDGIVMGVTGVLLLNSEKLPISCLFAEANPGLPDSRAAGEIIKVLDDYLDLKIDYKPLLKTAEEVQDKLKTILSKIKESTCQKQKSDLSYLG